MVAVELMGEVMDVPLDPKFNAVVETLQLLLTVAVQLELELVLVAVMGQDWEL